MEKDWCKAEPLGVPIIPPFVNGPENRSNKNLQMVLDQFPLDAERYRCRDVTGDLKPETFCNFYTRDVARAMSAPLPEGKTANQIYEMLAAGKVEGFTEISEFEAKFCIALGKFVVAVSFNAHGPGHITPCRDVIDGTIYVDHVGVHNARKIPAHVAHGEAPKKYFVHN